MRRLVLLAAFVALAPAPVSADAATQAWTSPVPGQEGRIYVSAVAGTETARAFVDADGAVTLAGTSVGTPAVAACPLTTPLMASGYLSSDAAPSADCSSPVPVTPARDGTWTVAISPWPEHGVALVPVVSGNATFQLAFDTAKTTVAAPPAAPPAPVDAPAPAPTEVLSPAPPAPDLPFATEPSVTPAAAHVPADVAAAPAAPVVTRQTIPAAIAKVVSAATPSAAVVLPLVVIAAAAAVLLLLRRDDFLAPDRVRRVGLQESRWVVAVLVAAVPLLLGEATVYKLGLVLIVLVGAIGLHLLVNWAGELSLAHAPLIGLPAFVVGKLSSDHGISPVYLLPVAVAVGLAAGLLVGVPAIRARGLQVALVTLAGGVAIDRFFFTREWVVGPSGGAQVDVPRLGPLTFATARSLYPLLAVLVAVAVVAAWATYRSKIGRALLWVKAHPDAAAAFGISVGRYRMLAYGLAGAFAGFAGGLTALWVQRLTPQAFPLSLSFTYLIIVALAGRGFVGGVAAAAAAVEGGRLFLASGDAFITYAAPLGLIFTLTRHRAGLNGLGRQLAVLAKERTMKHTVRPLVVAAAVLVAVGFGAIALAWYHAGNTSQVWIQNQELISGGVGGLAVVVLGVGLFLYDRLLVTREADAERWERLIATLTAERA